MRDHLVDRHTTAVSTAVEVERRIRTVLQIIAAEIQRSMRREAHGSVRSTAGATTVRPAIHLGPQHRPCLVQRECNAPVLLLLGPRLCVRSLYLPAPPTRLSIYLDTSRLAAAPRTCGAVLCCSTGQILSASECGSEEVWQRQPKKEWRSATADGDAANADVSGALFAIVWVPVHDEHVMI